VRRDVHFIGPALRAPSCRMTLCCVLAGSIVVNERAVHFTQEMTYGRSLQRHLYHFGLSTVLTEWAHLAQDRAGWHKPVTTPPFANGIPFVRQPRGDTRVTPEDKRRAVAQRAAEIAEQRAVFDANNNN